MSGSAVYGDIGREQADATGSEFERQRQEGVKQRRGELEPFHFAVGGNVTLHSLDRLQGSGRGHAVIRLGSTRVLIQLPRTIDRLKSGDVLWRKSSVSALIVLVFDRIKVAIVG